MNDRQARTATTGGGAAALEGVQARSPRFRRARPADAVELALETFVAGARVDMQALAAQLDVSPATLYRWFGSRARLLDRAFERLTEQFNAAARAQAQGEGDERVCDYARRLMLAASAFEPARAFVAREPQLALRLLLGREGSVHGVLADGLSAIISQSRPPGAAVPSDAQVHLIVQVATALVWATLSIGEEPQIESAVDIVRMTLASSPATG